MSEGIRMPSILLIVLLVLITIGLILGAYYIGNEVGYSRGYREVASNTGNLNDNSEHKAANEDEEQSSGGLEEREELKEPLPTPYVDDSATNKEHVYQGEKSEEDSAESTEEVVEEFHPPDPYADFGYYDVYGADTGPWLVDGKLTRLTITGAYWMGTKGIPKYVKMFRVTPLIVTVAEWNVERGHQQLSEFAEIAGEDFVLRAEGLPDVYMKVAGNFNKGDGTEQGLFFQISAEDQNKLVKGATYKLGLAKPPKAGYKWVISPGVTVSVPRNYKIPQTNEEAAEEMNKYIARSQQ